MGKGQRTRAAAGALTPAAIALIDAEKQISAVLRQELIEEKQSNADKIKDLKKRHEQSLVSHIESIESYKIKVQRYVDGEIWLYKKLHQVEKELKKFTDNSAILTKELNELKIVEQKSKMQAEKKDIELAKYEKELIKLRTDVLDQIQENEKKQKKIDKQRQTIDEMPEKIQFHQMEVKKKQYEEETEKTQKIRSKLEEQSRCYAKAEAMRMDLKRLAREKKYHQEMYDELEQRNEDFTVKVKKKKDKMTKELEKNKDKITKELEILVKDKERKKEELTEELEKKKEELTEEIDVFVGGKESAIESFRIKKGELKYYYYVRGDHDVKLFYDASYIDNINDVKNHKNDCFEIPSTSGLMFNYKICLDCDDYLVQQNTETGKTRLILSELVDIEQTKQFPKTWSPQYDRINYINIGTASYEYQKVLQFFKAGWNTRHYTLPTKIELQRVEQPWVWGKYKSSFPNYEQSNDIVPRHKWDITLSHMSGEFLCWHGTTPESHKSLCEKGVKIYYSGSAGGSLYGQGFYGAIQSSKSHQYSRNSCDAKGWNYMLLCGFNMGRAHKTETRHDNEKKPPDNYDSIYAEGGVANSGDQVHDEYIVFDSDQVVVYYILKYKR